jgi:hypothetical protein
MKLFKSLLVAPATLGLLAPVAATANEVTINDFNPAEELAITNSRVDGLEARLNNFEAGSFSETTTASFSTDFFLGSEDDDDAGVDTDDAVAAGYSFQIDLNTSFTGEDSLDISLDAGTQAGLINDRFDGNSGGDGLTVDGVAYTFPLGDKTTIIAGIDTDGSALFTTACVYGGPSDLLDDCANVNAGITGGGATVGGSYDFGNGLTAAFGIQTTEASVLTNESDDQYAANVAYTADSYGISLTYGVDENAALTDENKYTALNAYYTPDSEGLPSISVGYEFGDLGGNAAGQDEQSSAMLGLTWDEVGPGSAGVAAGYSNKREDQDELTQYEAYYSYPVNDSMTITPLIYTRDAAGEADDTTGMMVKTSFVF